MSKINDLIQSAREQGHFDSYKEWDIPKRYPFPVFKEQLGSTIFVYKLDSFKTKIEKEEVYKKIVDDYFKSEIANAKN